MSWILHIDTSAAEALVVVSRDGEAVAERRVEAARTQAALLPGLIDEALAAAGQSLSGMDAFAVCSGPGSYTGLRIAMATAKGFCFALDKPLLAHDKLLLLAMSRKKAFPGHPYYGTCLKAREGEYFLAVYDADGIAVQEPAHADTGTALRMLGTYDGASVAGEMPDGTPGAAPEPDAEVWARLAGADLERGAHASLWHAEPFYLKEVFIFSPK